MAKKQEQFEAGRIQGFCILNAEKVPGLWTPAVFGREHDAQAYMDKQHEIYGWDLSKHTIVPCTADVRLVHFG